MGMISEPFEEEIDKLNAQIKYLTRVIEVGYDKGLEATRCHTDHNGDCLWCGQDCTMGPTHTEDCIAFMAYGRLRLEPPAVETK